MDSTNDLELELDALEELFVMEDFMLPSYYDAAGAGNYEDPWLASSESSSESSSEANIEASSTTPPPLLPSPAAVRQKSPLFPEESLNDFKHVMYNLLAEQYNNPEKSYVEPIVVQENGVTRYGFRFDRKQKPAEKLAELYALTMRKARLDTQDKSKVIIQDLYKFYLRAAIELLCKYFERKDNFTYLYSDVVLFVPGETLDAAEKRIKAIKSKSSKRSRASL